MYSYIDLTATVLNCRLPATWHINYIRLSWCGSLIKLLRLQLMICFTQISRKTETGKNRNRGFLCKTEPKPNRKWNRRTVTALIQSIDNNWKLSTVFQRTHNVVRICLTRKSHWLKLTFKILLHHTDSDVDCRFTLRHVSSHICWLKLDIASVDALGAWSITGKRYSASGYLPIELVGYYVCTYVVDENQ